MGQILQKLICFYFSFLLHIKKRRYYQNYYIIHILLLTNVTKFSFFIILKLWYTRTQVQILQKPICFYFSFLLHIKKRKYYQNYYIIHLLLLTNIIKFSFFIILKLWYIKTRIQILQKPIYFYFLFIYNFKYNINYK